jgi:hypothetical protein
MRPYAPVTLATNIVVFLLVALGVHALASLALGVALGLSSGVALPYQLAAWALFEAPIIAATITLVPTVHAVAGWAATAGRVSWGRVMALLLMPALMLVQIAAVGGPLWLVLTFPPAVVLAGLAGGLLLTVPLSAPMSFLRVVVAVACTSAAVIAVSPLARWARSAASSLFAPPALAVPAQERITFTAVTVINPGSAPQPAQRITVAGGAVESIRAAAAGDDAPAATRRYRGSYVLPGMIDMHGHHPYSWMFGEATLWNLLYLAHGVTAVRDPGLPDGTSVGSTLLALRERLRQGELPGPRLFTCGTLIVGPYELPGAPVARNAAEARVVVDALAAAGVDCIKVRSWVPAEALASIRERASHHGLPVIGHVPVTVRFEDAHLDDAQHLFGIGERFPIRRAADLWMGWQDVDAARLDTIVRTSLQQAVSHTPTLVAFERLSHVLDPGTENEDVLRLLPPHWRSVIWAADGPGFFFWGVTPTELAELHKAMAKMQEMVHRLHSVGVRIHVGTDALVPHVVPGASLHEELELLVGSGFTIEEAWIAATRGAGEALRTPLLGTLQPGAPADFGIFRANPVYDLGALTSLEAVVVDGRLYTKEWLEQAIAQHRDYFARPLYTAVITGLGRKLALAPRIASSFLPTVEGQH